MPTSSPPSLPTRIVAAGATDIGRTRKHNEDAVLLRHDLGLFLLADGAGGHEAGNVASALATTTIARYFESTEKSQRDAPEFDDFGLSTGARRLSAAIQRANREIVEISCSSNKHRGMGTTIVAAHLSLKTGKLHLGHVGDSRCYRLRAGRLEQLTHDHSLLNEVIEMRPDLSDAVIAKLPRHVVTRALGMSDAVPCSVRTYDVVSGDKYLLSSDGLHAAVPAEDILEALLLVKSSEEQVQLLIDMAKDAGSRDNIAVVIVDCDALPLIPDAKPLPAVARKSAPLPQVTTSDSVPEIVILDVEYESALEDTRPHRVRVIPARSADEGMLNALDGLVTPRRKDRLPSE